MIRLYHSRQQRRIARVLLGAMGINILAPIMSYGLTSGPSQPEFSSFEPVTTNQMVDEFTGDFTYNIPVLTVPGPQGGEYPLSLSYHSGASPEDEASWVGYGWTLNPGAINRNTRGFPDDYDGESVTYWNKRPKNWTVTAGIKLGTEAFGADLKSDASIRYNNNQGFGVVSGAGISLGKGVVSLGLNNNDGESTFSMSINPAALLNQEKIGQNSAMRRFFKGNKFSFGEALAKAVGRAGRLNTMSLIGGNHGFCTFSDMNRANQVTSYHGGAINVSAGFQANFFPVPVGGTVDVSGSYSWQENDSRDQLRAYGYMYTGHTAGSGSIQDYYVEKESPYNQRDLFLGAPFHNADIFSVSGEGVGGGFRLYHSQVGEFAPNGKSSSIQIANYSPEIAAGWTMGPGSDLGISNQTFTEGAWQSSRVAFSSPGGPEDESVAFRFINDLGGNWISGQQNDDAEQADISGKNLNTSGLDAQRRHAERPGRSSHIAYRTKDQIAPGGNVNLLRTLSRRSDLVTDMALGRQEVPVTAVCEMAVTATTGSKYIYGLPIFAKNERNLSYGAQGSVLNDDKYTINRSSSDTGEDTKIGEERMGVYASSYLLTDIQTPDYVDRTLNGPTQDDFGGYTRLHYEKKYSLQNQNTGLYHWRMPYNGLIYQRNSLSDAQDDLGTFASGDKEVAYLSRIQTKTHTAIFFTEARDDGYSAPDDASAKEGGGRPSTAKASYKLKRIELYENSQLDNTQPTPTPLANEKPIKIVHFEYAAANSADELCKGLPNSSTRGGKLTLKQVWFSYNVAATEVPNTKRPYIFDYQYPNANVYPVKYQPAPAASTIPTDDVTRGLTVAGPGDQNPSYATHQLDAWGNYQSGGAARNASMIPWLNQRPAATFDPAAWQLKKITLPTGGEIHVQYEQDDYNYVQDKRAHAMVKLLPSSNAASGQFDLDLRDVLNPNDLEYSNNLYKVQDAIRKTYKNGSEKIFFKLLYNLSNLSSGQPGINSCNAEYIKGYIDVTAADVVYNTALGINTVRVQVQGSDKNGITKFPDAVCADFLRTQRMGKLNANGICDPAANGVSNDSPGPAQLIRYILARASALYHPSGAVCGEFNPSLSYLRVPMVTPKKGGGVRVKRLLTFDKGIDNQPVLYGSEYIYRMEDPERPGEEISSGVATTEPAAMREENILVSYLPRKTQGLTSKITSGEDLKQGEGPLGESMLPAPTVGYSRVVVRNIHSGNSTPGYSVSEFATAREYPMLVKQTEIRREKDFFFIWALFATSLRNNVYATQGYSFILNNMHGQIKRKASYPGYYIGLTTPATKPVTEEVYTYFEPPRQLPNKPYKQADAIPVIKGLRQEPELLFPGKEIDMTYAQHAVSDDMADLNFEVDVEVAWVFIPLPPALVPVVYPTVKPTLILTKSELDTHVTTKVVRYPAVVRSIESTQDGITHTTTNLAFDQFTGQTVLSKSNDEFKGGYLQESVMASWVHPELGAKYASEGKTITGGTFVPGQAPSYDSWLTFTASNCAGLGRITRGDQLVFSNDNNRIYFAEAPDFANKRVRLYPVSLTTAPSSLPSGGAVSVTVMTSGRSNQLGIIAGTTTYHIPDNSIYQQLIKAPAPVSQAASITAGQQAFANALAALVPTAPSSSPVITVHTLTGPYSNINMSAYAAKLQGVACITNPASVTIKNVKVSTQTRNGALTVTLRSFDVECEPGIIPQERTIEN